MSFMLSTVDNPYNPHTHWTQWYAYDHSQGYFTSEYLGRIAITSDELSDTDNELAISNAIDEIIFEDVTDLYIKVSSDFKPKPVSLAQVRVTA